jgi:hypothetical protein
MRARGKIDKEGHLKKKNGKNSKNDDEKWFIKIYVRNEVGKDDDTWGI